MDPQPVDMELAVPVPADADGGQGAIPNAKRKRGGALTALQREIAKKEIGDDEKRRAELGEPLCSKKRKLGYNALLRKYPDAGFTSAGLNPAADRQAQLAFTPNTKRA